MLFLYRNRRASASIVRIPLCAIIFGAGSRSLELQLQAFPRGLLMMNVGASSLSKLSKSNVLRKQTAPTLRHDHNYECGGQVGLGL